MNNDIPIKVVETIDPILNLEHADERVYGEYNAGLENNYVFYKSQSTINNSNVTVVCNPPNEKTIIDPKVWQTTQFVCVFQNDANGGLTGWFETSLGMTDSPRAFPLNQITSTTVATINGFNITSNTNEYINTILRYNNGYAKYDSEFSQCPSMLDQFQDYNAPGALGSNRNSLGLYQDITVQVPRGNWQMDSVVYSTLIGKPANSTCTIAYTTVEPVFLSPFWFSKTGLTKISTLTMQLVFSNLRRVWSQSSTSIMTLSSVNVGAVQFNFRFITAKQDEIIPDELIYPYYEIQTISTSVSNIAYGATGQISLNATNLQAIPQRIYICARKGTNYLSEKDSDTFEYVSQIQVQWNNRSNLLSSALSSDLYQLSRQEGVNYSYDQWGINGFNNSPTINADFSAYPANLKSGQIGSIICLNVARTLGLKDGEAASLLQNPQFSLKANIQNINVSNLNIAAGQQIQLFAFIVYEGVINIRHQHVTSSISVLDKAEILKAEGGNYGGKKTKTRILAKIDPDEKNIFGGNINDFLNDITPFLKTGVDIAKIVGGKKKMDDDKKGGVLIGGKRISRKEMMKNLNKLL
jgi:hypothetical protein